MKTLFKTLILGGIFLLANITSVHSAEMYVTDVLKLTVRAGQGNKYKVIDVIETGQSVSLLQTDKGWALIQLPNKKEGWVERQYLTSTRPSRSALKKLKTKHNNLVLQSAALLEENGKLKEKNQNLLNDLNTRQQALSSLKNDYDSLKHESADFLKLKSAYQETAAKLSIQTGQVKKLQKELSQIERDNFTAWMVTGASIFLVGFLIGLSLRRQRKRSTLR